MDNDIEKALRPAKAKLKVSGCSRTEAGAENYATVASVIQTAVKNGQNPFEILQVIANLAEAWQHHFSHHYREVHGHGRLAMTMTGVPE